MKRVKVQQDERCWERGVRTYVCMYICMYVCVCVRARVFVFVCVCIVLPLVSQTSLKVTNALHDVGVGFNSTFSASTMERV
jgi:hypothetical protein